MSVLPRSCSDDGLKAVRSAREASRLAILGPVEARMQSADRIILGGFNEGNWPPRPSDPWTMRKCAMLLSKPHGLALGLNANLDGELREVIITAFVTAMRPRHGRWLQRRCCHGGAGHRRAGSGRSYRMQALSPVPPLADRSTSANAASGSAPAPFSATEIDDWIIDL